MQFQPYVFSKMFPALAPSGMDGEPGLVSGPVLGAARLFSSATDLNSGPFLLLIAAAFWPRRQR